MQQGDRVTVTHAGSRFIGTIRFASPQVIIIDEGNGITASIKYDPASNTWRLGKSIVTIAVEQPFAERLKALLKRARQMEQEVASWA